MAIKELNRVLRLLAELRENLAQAKKDRTQAYEDMLDTNKGREWVGEDINYKALAKSEKETKAVAGQKAVEAYNGKDKRVTLGASVAESMARNVIIPDRSVAEAWCREFAQALFVLDIAAFNDLVSGGHVPEKIAHVETVTTIKPRIDSNLSPLLKEAGESSNE